MRIKRVKENPFYSGCDAQVNWVLSECVVRLTFDIYWVDMGDKMGYAPVQGYALVQGYAPVLKLEFLELEFLKNFQVELEFHNFFFIYFF